MEAIETIEAPVEAIESAAPMLVPACPHCGEDPLKLALMTQVFPGGAIGSIMFCATCRKTISVQLVGMQRPSGGSK